MNFSRVPSSRSIASAIRAQRGADPRLDLLRVVLGDHPDVVDEVGEQRRDHAPVAGLREWPGGWRPLGGRRSGASARTDARCAPHWSQKRACRAGRCAARSEHGTAGLLCCVPRAASLAAASAPVRRWSAPVGPRPGRADAHPCGDDLGDRGQGATGRTRLALGDRGDAHVAALADGDVERDRRRGIRGCAPPRTARRHRDRRSRSARRSAGRRTRSCSRRGR